MKIKKTIMYIMVSFFLVSQISCGSKNRDATGEEVSLGLITGAILGQVIMASTPATFAGALLGITFGVAIIDLSEDEVATVVGTIENLDVTD